MKTTIQELNHRTLCCYEIPHFSCNCNDEHNLFTLQVNDREFDYVWGYNLSGKILEINYVGKPKKKYNIETWELVSDIPSGPYCKFCFGGGNRTVGGEKYYPLWFGYPRAGIELAYELMRYCDGGASITFVGLEEYHKEDILKEVFGLIEYLKVFGWDEEKLLEKKERIILLLNKEYSDTITYNIKKPKYKKGG